MAWSKGRAEVDGGGACGGGDGEDPAEGFAGREQAELALMCLGG